MADADYGEFSAPPLARGRGRIEPKTARPDPGFRSPAAGFRPGHETGRSYAGHPPEDLAAAAPAAPVLGPRAERIVNVAGAVGSVALVVGLGWWGYDLAMRDLRGVPVVRAMEGPMRIAPDDPGGEVVEHQGLAVNDVAAQGGAAPPPDRLILAPKPVELSLEDTPGLSGAPPAPEAEMQPARLEMSDSDQPGVQEQAVDAGADPAVAAALAEALGGAEAAPEEPVEAAALDAQGNPPPEGAITRSPRPVARPVQAVAAAAVVPEKPQVIDPATLAPGTRLVQFGAFDSPDEAEAEWMRLAGRFSELMNGKAMVIQMAESSGRTFYRLRGHGFDSEDDARRFCAALTTEGANCTPVAHR